MTCPYEVNNNTYRWHTKAMGSVEFKMRFFRKFGFIFSSLLGKVWQVLIFHRAQLCDVKAAMQFWYVLHMTSYPHRNASKMFEVLPTRLLSLLCVLLPWILHS